MESKFCRKCHEIKPCTEKFFGYNPQGGLRHVCRTCMNANNRRLYELNPEQTKVRRDNYKKRLDAAEGSYTETEIMQIRTRLKDSCFYCGEDLKGGGEKDHIIPLSKSGSNWASNITLACLGCNRDKCNKSVFEFVKWRRERGLKISTYCMNYLAAIL